MANLDVSGTPEEIFDRYYGDYDNVMNTTDSIVDTWKWATGLMYETRPIGLYSYGAPGEWLDKKKGNTVYHYGLDTKGTILVARRYDKSVCEVETFFIHRPERVVRLQYNHLSKTPLLWGIQILEFVDGVAASCSGLVRSLKWNSEFAETYYYDNQILIKADCKSIENGRVVSTIFELDYDDQDVLQQIFRRSSDGNTSVLYKRPGFVMDSKAAVEARVSAELVRELQSIINKFIVEHGGEGWYGFAIVISVQGGIYSCAFATEKGLDVVARKYADKGYKPSSGDTLNSLREWLRWAHPEDGWYIYDLKDVELMLRPIEDRNILSQREIEKLLLKALADLDASDGLGTEEERQSLVIGLSYVEDTEQFEKTAKKLNPASNLVQFRKEIKRRDLLGQQIAKQSLLVD